MKRLSTILAFAILGALLAATSAAWAQSRTVSGAPTVIDGRTLTIEGRRFRLFGIDVPGLGQVCERFGRAYPCGNVARTALMDLVAGTSVTCRPVAGERARLSGTKDGKGGAIALCQATSVDLSWNMVHTGWALAEPVYGQRYYGAIETAARKRRSGLWKGTFAKPWVWRASQTRRKPGKRVCIRGRLTNEGVECQALRGDDGRLYTLGGPKVTAKTGAPVCACGTIVRFSTCMQGTTIAVETLRQPEACPAPKK